MNYVESIRDIEKIKEMKALLKKRSERDCFLFTFGINTGLRISDILKFKVSDLKGKKYLKINEVKTDKLKRFKINDYLRKEIDHYILNLKDDDFLFPSRIGKKAISRVMAYKILNETGKQLNIETIGTHTMRKTFGYFFYKQTNDIALLQDLFNHSKPEITLRYIGITQEKLDSFVDNICL